MSSYFSVHGSNFKKGRQEVRIKGREGGRDGGKEVGRGRSVLEEMSFVKKVEPAWGLID